MAEPLDSWLAHLPIDGEVLRFDLAPHRSVVSRQLLQVRVRLTARAFGAGPGLVAANVVEGGAALEVDAAALQAANGFVRSRLVAGPAEAVGQLRQLAAARASVDEVAASFAGAGVADYVETAGVLAALGSLRFCLPDTLRPRLAALVGADLVEPLLAPDGPSLWSVVRGRELALARRRRIGPAAAYDRLLAAHQRASGYLRGEDVDFRAFESVEAVDARVAELATGDVEGERRRLAGALATDAAAKSRARGVFAEALATSAGEGVVTLLGQVLLARALAEHEDVNRRAKVRMLRDLRDVAVARGLDIERVGLDELAAEPVGVA